MIQQYFHICATLSHAFFDDLELFALGKNPTELQHYIFELLRSKDPQNAFQSGETTSYGAALEKPYDDVAEALTEQLGLVKPSLPK